MPPANQAGLTGPARIVASMTNITPLGTFPYTGRHLANKPRLAICALGTTLAMLFARPGTLSIPADQTGTACPALV